MAVLLGQATRPAGYRVHLYAADLTPSHSDPSTLFVVNEADYTGYADLPLVSWDTITFDGTAARSKGNASLFQVANPAPIGNWVYGYYVTAVGSPSVVLWAGRFSPAPLSMVHPGELLAVVPELTTQSLFG